MENSWIHKFIKGINEKWNEIASFRIWIWFDESIYYDYSCYTKRNFKGHLSILDIDNTTLIYIYIYIYKEKERDRQTD